MAVLFLGTTKCALCGKLLQEGEAITSLPAISDKMHPLYEYFDRGFHTRCFENFDKKEDILKVIAAEEQRFKNSDYYKEMTAKYGMPGNP